jgi:hypothetical protein
MTTPHLLTCDAKRPTGEVCGAAALVHASQHEYDTLVYQGKGGYQYKLRASHYEVECPNCGKRTQIVKPEPAE